MEIDIKQTLDEAFKYIESDDRNTLIMESHIYNLIEALIEQQKENIKLEETISHLRWTMLSKIFEIKKLKEFIENNEYDLTPEFRKSFPDGFK